MNYIPIQVKFSVEERTIPVTITETRNVMMEARFKTSYRKQTPLTYYMGSGYVGDTFANRLI